MTTDATLIGVTTDATLSGVTTDATLSGVVDCSIGCKADDLRLAHG
ncbi:MAG: hypothetical protein ACI81V_000226 [Lentimonas sp.]